eukprot:49491-Eustigmatos_ZCMA.PRE.1
MHPHHAAGGGGTMLAHINPPRVAMRSRSSPLLSPNSEISELMVRDLQQCHVLHVHERFGEALRP